MKKNYRQKNVMEKNTKPLFFGSGCGSCLIRTFQLEVRHLLKCREEIDLLANELGDS